MIKLPVEIKGKYLRIRVDSPRRFLKVIPEDMRSKNYPEPHQFETHDIGEKGHTKRIAGVIRGERVWATQAFIVLLEDIKNKREKTIRFLHSIAEELNPASRKKLNELISKADIGKNPRR